MKCTKPKLEGKKLTFKRCKLVVGGSAIALKILADDPRSEASFCSTRNLSIHGFDSVKFTCTQSIINYSQVSHINRNTIKY
jgi:hypothetical protein